MTREQAKELLPIIQAYAEGKTIQYKVNEVKGGWQDMYNPSFNYLPSEYRIKPEPKYRPFKNQEECWNEMLKHKPFGWVKNKDAQYINLLSVRGDKDFDNLFEAITFIDGAPYGIKEEQFDIVLLTS